MARNRNPRLHWRRALLATTAALWFGAQNAAWATCLDGTTFPAGGYQIGKAPVKVAANWSPNVFTSTEGSNFIPDVSTNDQTTGAPTAEGTTGVRPGLHAMQAGDAGNKAGTVTNAWILPPRRLRIASSCRSSRTARSPTRRHPVPGCTRHPGLRSDEAQWLYDHQPRRNHNHNPDTRPGQQLRRPARLRDCRFQQRWRACGHHCGNRNVLYVRRRHQGRLVPL